MKIDTKVQKLRCSWGEKSEKSDENLAKEGAFGKWNHTLFVLLCMTFHLTYSSHSSCILEHKLQFNLYKAE